MKEKQTITPFGKQVKIALMDRGMTSKELAKELGFSQSTICDVIFGRNSYIETKHKIAEYLDLTIC